MFKGVDFFPHGTKWDVVGKRFWFVGLSWVLALIAGGLLMTRGLNYGVDFKGGALVEIQSKSGDLDIGTKEVRQIVTQMSQPLARLGREEEQPHDRGHRSANQPALAVLHDSVL